MHVYMDWDERDALRALRMNKGCSEGYSSEPLGLSVNATPFSESLEGPEEEPYGIGVKQKYIDGDVDSHPCCARPTLWFTSEVQTENRYIRKNSFNIIILNHVQQYLRVSRSKPRSLT